MVYSLVLGIVATSQGLLSDLKSDIGATALTSHKWSNADTQQMPAFGYRRPVCVPFSAGSLYPAQVVDRVNYHAGAYRDEQDIRGDPDVFMTGWR